MTVAELHEQAKNKNWGYAMLAGSLSTWCMLITKALHCNYQINEVLHYLNENVFHVLSTALK